MDKNIENIEKLTPEELAAEKALAELPKEDEVRTSVITEFGFDPENDKERIERVVAKEMSHRTSLAKAIGQKIKNRNEAIRLAALVPPTPAPSPIVPQAAKPVADEVNEALEKRDLDDMVYPDNIKQEIQRIARITGKSVKAAARDPYIVQTFIEPYEKQAKTDKAAITPNGNNSGGNSSAFSKDSPPKIDMSTPEKFKESDKLYQDWKQWMQSQGN